MRKRELADWLLVHSNSLQEHERRLNECERGIDGAVKAVLDEREKTARELKDIKFTAGKAYTLAREVSENALDPRLVAYEVDLQSVWILIYVLMGMCVFLAIGVATLLNTVFG